MERTFYFIAILFLIGFSCLNCEDESKNEDQGVAPELPMKESIVPDFSAFNDNTKSGQSKISVNPQTQWNILAASVNVAAWNTILFVTLAVPVSTFAYSFEHEPVYIGGGKWEWSYQAGGAFDAYHARLVGEIGATEITWEMYISKTGFGAFEDFKWFEGTSKIDRSGGEWTLYHSPQFPEEVITIEWAAENDEIKDITYSFVRELKDNRTEEPFNGSWLTYGRNSELFNLFYNIHFFSEKEADFVDVNIEMNEETNAGRIKATNWANGETGWHCWDENFIDVDCE